MAYPVDRKYNFHGFQQADPSSPLPADQVDIEFDNAVLNLNEIWQKLNGVLNPSGTNVKAGSIGETELDPAVIEYIKDQIGIDLSGDVEAAQIAAAASLVSANASSGYAQEALAYRDSAQGAASNAAASENTTLTHRVAAESAAAGAEGSAVAAASSRSVATGAASTATYEADRAKAEADRAEAAGGGDGVVGPEGPPGPPGTGVEPYVWKHVVTASDLITVDASGDLPVYAYTTIDRPSAIDVPIALSAGQEVYLRVYQDSTGGHTILWDPSIDAGVSMGEIFPEDPYSFADFRIMRGVSGKTEVFYLDGYDHAGGAPAPDEDAVTISEIAEDGWVYDQGWNTDILLASVPLTGNGTVGHTVRVRAVSAESDNPRDTNFTETTVGADGVWTVDLPIPVSLRDQEFRPQVQSVQGAYQATGSNRFAVGRVFAFFSQSVAKHALDAVDAQVQPGAKLAMQDPIWNNVQWVDQDLTAENPKFYRMKGNTGTQAGVINNIGPVGLANVLRTLMPGMRYMCVDLGHSGTSRHALGNDLNNNRSWQPLAAAVSWVASKGTTIGLIAEHWYASDIGYISNFSTVFSALYMGQWFDGSAWSSDGFAGSNVHPGSPDPERYTHHCLWDITEPDEYETGRGIFARAKTKWLPMQPGRRMAVENNGLSYTDSNTPRDWAGMQDLHDVFWNDSRVREFAAPVAETWPLYVNGYGGSNGGSHPEVANKYGGVYWAGQFAVGVARADGLDYAVSKGRKVVVAGDGSYADVYFNAPADDLELTTIAQLRGEISPEPTGPHYMGPDGIIGFEIRRFVSDGSGGRTDVDLDKRPLQKPGTSGVGTEFQGSCAILDRGTGTGPSRSAVVRITPVVPFAEGDFIEFMRGSKACTLDGDRDADDEVTGALYRYQPIWHSPAWDETGDLYPFNGSAVQPTLPEDLEVGASSSNQQPTTVTNNVTLTNGINLVFDGQYSIGFYEDGEPFIVAPGACVLNSTTGQTHGQMGYSGMMVNPCSGEAGTDTAEDQAFDIRGSSYNPTLDTLPSHNNNTAVTLFPGNVAVFAQSMDPGETSRFTASYGVLTVVDSVPPFGALRPPVRRGSLHRPTWTLDQIDANMSVFTKNLAVGADDQVSGFGGGHSAASRATRLSALDRTQNGWFVNWNHLRTMDVELGPSGYGRTYTHHWAAALVDLHSDDMSDVDKRVLARLICTEGIQQYGCVLDGAVWQENGGWTHGRRAVVLAAGIILDDQYMVDAALNGAGRDMDEAGTRAVLPPWSEERCYMYVSATPVSGGAYPGIVQPPVDYDERVQPQNYQTEHVGLPEWAIAPTRGSAPTSHVAATYRWVNFGSQMVACLALEQWRGHAMVRSLTDYAPVFDTLDRYLRMSRDNKDGNFYGSDAVYFWGTPRTSLSKNNSFESEVSSELLEQWFMAHTRTLWSGPPEQMMPPGVDAAGTLVTVTNPSGWDIWQGNDVTEYELRWSDDGGVTWNPEVPFASFPETFTAPEGTILVQIRGHAGALTGPWSVNQPNLRVPEDSGTAMPAEAYAVRGSTVTGAGAWKPVVVTNPVIAIGGTGVVGDTLTVTTQAAFDGSPAPTVAGQWFAAGDAVPGATGLTTQATAEVAYEYRRTATNSQGSTVATSNVINVGAAVSDMILPAETSFRYDTNTPAGVSAMSGLIEFRIAEADWHTSAGLHVFLQQSGTRLRFCLNADKGIRVTALKPGSSTTNILAAASENNVVSPDTWHVLKYTMNIAQGEESVKFWVDDVLAWDATSQITPSDTEFVMSTSRYWTKFSDHTPASGSDAFGPALIRQAKVWENEFNTNGDFSGFGTPLGDWTTVDGNGELVAPANWTIIN